MLAEAQIRRGAILEQTPARVRRIEPRHYRSGLANGHLPLRRFVSFSAQFLVLRGAAAAEPGKGVAESHSRVIDSRGGILCLRRNALRQRQVLEKKCRKIVATPDPGLAVNSGRLLTCVASLIPRARAMSLWESPLSSNRATSFSATDNRQRPNWRSIDAPSPSNNASASCRHALAASLLDARRRFKSRARITNVRIRTAAATSAITTTAASTNTW